MPFTKPNINYSHIQEQIKGITISPKSISLLKAAYAGELEVASKLLANYMWLTTRDITMILITVALLVLAEKNGEKLNTELEALRSHDGNIKKLFTKMAEGDGKQAKDIVANSKEFKNLFFSILKQANVKDNKIESAWKGYVNQIGRITKWKFSIDALQKNVSPALAYTLQPGYCKEFMKTVKDISQGTKRILEMMQSTVGQSVVINSAQVCFRDFIDDLTAERRKTLLYFPRNDHLTVRYELLDQDIVTNVKFHIDLFFAKDEIIDYLAKKKIFTAKKFKDFLKRTAEQDFEKLTEINDKQNTKKRVAEIVETILQDRGVYDHYKDTELEQGKYYKFQKEPFIIATDEVSDILCVRDNVEDYLWKNNITTKEEISQELERCFSPISQKLQLLKELPSKLALNLPTAKYKFEFEFDMSYATRSDVFDTANGLKLKYQYYHASRTLTICFYTPQVLDEMRDDPEGIISKLNASVGEILNVVQEEREVETIVKQISEGYKNKELNKAALKLGNIDMANERSTYVDLDIPVDGITVWIIKSTSGKTIDVVLPFPIVLKKLKENNCTQETEMKQFLEKLVEKVFNELSDQLSTKPPETPQ